MSVATFDPAAQAISMSEEAAVKVRQFMAEEDDVELYLRVFVQGGGCSGFQYGFTFDEQPQDEDIHFELHGLKLLIDPMSYPYLDGAVIDYQQSIAGARFSIVNPNASTTCGCGSSFSA